jgi:CheY-like chemotaxis protein
MALILILDAETASASELAHALTERGHRVRCCERSHQALRLSRLLAFDLLWMVWPLTGMDGLEFMRRLRHARPMMPVAIACRQEPEALLRLQLKARGATLLLRADVPLPLAAAAAEACIPGLVP